MSLSKLAAATLTAALLAAAMASLGLAQESKPTVRHHRVEEVVPDDSSSPEVSQAETALQHSDFAAAEPLLQKAIAAKHNDYRAWFDLGYVYNATKRPMDAIEAYRKSVALKPDVFEANLNLGILLVQHGDKAEAAKVLQGATQLKPESRPDEGMARAWQWLGLAEQDTDAKQALAAFSEAAKLSPKDAQPHLLAAQLQQKGNNMDAAAQEFQAAASLDLKSKEALTALADIYNKQKKYPEAEAALRNLLAIDPSNSRARVQLSHVLTSEGKHEEAVEELRKGLQGNSGDPRAALELGAMYVQAGKYPEAEQQLRLAVQKMPKDAEAHLALGSLLMHLKKYPESQQELLIAVQLKPDLPEAYGNLAVVAAENKNYQLTLKALDYRAKFLPEGPATYFLRATTFDNLKAVAQAVDYYQRFLEAAAGQLPDQEWQARHRLMALDPKHADKYSVKKK